MESSHISQNKNLDLIELVDGFVVFVLFETVEVVPPETKPTRFENELEPRSEGILERCNILVEILAFNPLDFADFRWVRLHIDVLLKEENVVDLVLAPHTIAAINVVNTRQIVEVFRSHLRR